MPNFETSKPRDFQHRIVAVDAREGSDIRLARDQHKVKLAAFRELLEFFGSHWIVRSVTPRGSVM